MCLSIDAAGATRSADVLAGRIPTSVSTAPLDCRQNPNPRSNESRLKEIDVPLRCIPHFL